MLAAAPSSTLKFTLTRLRSSGVTVVVMTTPYFPRDRFGALERCPVEDAPFRDSVVLERLLQLILVEFLEAYEIDRVDRRTLFERKYQDVPLNFDTHVLEETRREKRLDGLRRLLVGHGIADLDRQIAENGAGLRPLDALDANVLDRKRLKRAGARRKEQRKQPCEQVSRHLQLEINRLISL
jgi:hypothetical protein